MICFDPEKEQVMLVMMSFFKSTKAAGKKPCNRS